jgi:hypothetical protein
MKWGHRSHVSGKGGKQRFAAKYADKNAADMKRLEKELKKPSRKIPTPKKT